MKITSALIEFAIAIGVKEKYAIGLIDQLHEVEKDGLDLVGMDVRLLSRLIDEPEAFIIKAELVDRYMTYKATARRQMNRQYCRQYRDRKNDSETTVERQYDDSKTTEKNLSERERETGPLDGPSSPTPLSPPLSPSERKREVPPTTLRVVPPEGGQTTTKRRVQRFVKPTLDELKAYAAEIGYANFDASYFVDYYDQIGWTIGRDKPMKDWKATIRNWKRRDDERRGVDSNAEHRRDTEEDPLAGFSPEDIEEIRRIANDGKHWG